jgi:hypothetical protein
MALYDTRFGLPQSSVDYLNQPLPDISGIFSLPQATEVMEENVTDTESPVGLTEEQLRLLYPQVGGGDGPRGGGDFGNLDLSTAKQFNINGNIVTGYKNLNTGLYQDISGLNIQNLGGNTIYGGILDALSEKMGFKRNQPTYPGLLDMVSPKALIRNPGMFRSFFARQDVAKQKAIQDAVNKANLEAAREVQTMQQAAANKAAAERGDRRGGYQSSWGGGGGAKGDTGGFMGGSGKASEMGSF